MEGKCKGEIAAGRISDEDDVPRLYPAREQPLIDRRGIFECGRVHMCRCEAVVYGVDICGACAHCLSDGKQSVRIAHAEHIAAAVQLKDDAIGFFIGAVHVLHANAADALVCPRPAVRGRKGLCSRIGLWAKEHLHLIGNVGLFFRTREDHAALRHREGAGTCLRQGCKRCCNEPRGKAGLDGAAKPCVCGLLTVSCPCAGSWFSLITAMDAVASPCAAYDFRQFACHR